MTALHSVFTKSPVYAPDDPRIKDAIRSGIGYTVDYSKQPYKRMEKKAK
jgi:hypothetical protein